MTPVGYVPGASQTSTRNATRSPYYVLAQLEDRAAFGRHDAEFIDYPLQVPVLSTAAYVRPLDAAPLEGAQTDFDLLFVLCSNECSKNLVEALQIDRRLLSIEAWSKGYCGAQEDEEEKDDQGDQR